MPLRSIYTEKTNLLLLSITKGCVNKREGGCGSGRRIHHFIQLDLSVPPSTSHLLSLSLSLSLSPSLPHTHYITRVFSFFPFVSLLSTPLADEIIALISLQLLWFLGASGKRSSAQPQITST